MVEKLVRLQPLLRILPYERLDEVPRPQAYILGVHDLVFVHIQYLLHRYFSLFVLEGDLVCQQLVR